MARPRTPLDKAKITGQTYSNSTRFKNRKEPKVSKKIGPAPSWVNSGQRKVWALFCGELPWLNYSHRAILEISCTVRAQIHAGDECSVAAFTLLRQCLGSLGATPADASKISIPDDEDEDPADKYFN